MICPEAISPLCGCWGWGRNKREEQVGIWTKPTLPHVSCCAEFCLRCSGIMGEETEAWEQVFLIMSKENFNSLMPLDGRFSSVLLNEKIQQEGEFDLRMRNHPYPVCHLTRAQMERYLHLTGMLGWSSVLAFQCGGASFGPGIPSLWATYQSPLS